MPNDASDKYITNRNPTARFSPISRDGDVSVRYSATATRRTAAKICERYATLNGRNFKRFWKNFLTIFQICVKNIDLAPPICYNEQANLIVEAI